MKIVCFAITKGGTGKSTVCFNVATTYALLNPSKKVLVIDLDMQSNLSNFFGIEAFDRIDYDSSDLILGNKKPADLIIKNQLEYAENIDIIPSSFKLMLNELTLNNAVARETKLDRMIEKYKDTFNDYDVIFIDTNPSFSIYNINALYASDCIINVVKNNCISSIKALEMSNGLWRGMKSDLGKRKREQTAIILNMDTNNSNSAKRFKETLLKNEDFKGNILDSKIRNTVAISDAIESRQPIYLSNKKHMATEDILNVIKELEDKNIL